MKTLACILVALALSVAAPRTASADDDGVRFNLEAVQGVLTLQGLDGWLMIDQAGQNRVARYLVNPGRTTRRWFYLIPASGQPVVLVHRAEVSQFDAVPGKKIEYTGHRDLKEGLRTMLKGVKRVGMEYAPKSGIASLSLVDAQAVELVRSMRVKVESSSRLVQFTKSLWGPKGRVAHYVAVHHLTKLREQALAFVARKIKAGEKVTEHDVQKFISEGYKVRGISGPEPVVAVNENAADPNYVPSARSSTEIRRGDLILLGMAAALDAAQRPIYADITWMAYVGDAVPERYATTFAVLVAARDAALEHVRERAGRRRPVLGYEADQKARQVVAAGGHGAKFLHRTGHSLDTSLQGDGANLDDYESHDTRTLVQGAGFTIEPGVYYKGDFGMRAEINVYVGTGGVEVTTPAQTAITALLAP